MVNGKQIRDKLKFKRPTFKEVLKWIAMLPLRIGKFLLLLPVNLVKFIIHLPRNIWRAWTAGARGIVKLEDWIKIGWGYLKEARRYQQMFLPRSALLELLRTEAHPLRLWHGLCALRARLRPAVWDAQPGLGAIPKALTWARQYRRHRSRFEDIEALRSILYANDSVLEDDPLKPTVGLRGRQTSVRRRWGALLHGLVRYSGAQRVVELGSGYGISSLYLARGLIDNYPVRTCMLITLEQDKDRADKADHNLYRLGYNDFAETRTGKIEDTLPGALEDTAPVNLVFIDGPQNEDELLRYFSQIKSQARPGALIILTGIHASPTAGRAWNTIRKMPQVAATVDLWRWGIVVTGKGPALHLCARL